jgi:hypothetical protein
MSHHHTPTVLLDNCTNHTSFINVIHTITVIVVLTPDYWRTMHMYAAAGNAGLCSVALIVWR